MIEAGREEGEEDERSRSATIPADEKKEDQPPREGSRQLARKSTLGFTSNTTITLFGLVSLVVVKRFMGYEAVGMIAFSLAFCQMFAIVGDLGFTKAHLKRVSEGLDQGMCNATLLTVKFFLTIVMGTCILTVVLVQKYFFQ